MAKLSPEAKAAREAHMAEHHKCWLCEFLGIMKPAKAELHHIAGRGRNHDVRENYASLCREHHAAIQSRTGAELLCLLLVKVFNPNYYSPETICRLRGRAPTWITDSTVTECEHVVCLLLFDVLRNWK